MSATAGNLSEIADAMNTDAPTEVFTPKSKRKALAEPLTPRNALLQEALQTPRRSVRKSFKPVQDYEEIVCTRQLRSTLKENEEEIKENENEETEPAHRWTPAKVGRTSQKRAKRGRRTRVNKRTNKSLSEQSVSEAIEIDDENEKEHGTTNMESTEKHAHVVLEEKQTSEVLDAQVESIKTQILVQPALSNDEMDFVKDTEMPEAKLLSISESKVEDNFETVEDEMPSLIFCDDTEDLDDVFAQKTELPLVVVSTDPKTVESVNTDEAALNETFDASDCVILNESAECGEKQKSLTKPSIEDEDSRMETLHVTDDEDTKMTPVKPPRINLFTVEDGRKTLMSTPAIKKRSSAYRFPTPFKARQKDVNEIEALAKVQQENDAEETIELSLVTLEPKDIVLRSIRKRSLSVGIEGRQQTKQLRTANRVTFYSPANQTVVIEDIDLQIAASSKKNINKKATNLTVENAVHDNNVTKRRKRSLSFDESMLSKKSKIPKPAFAKLKTTPMKPRLTPQKPAALSRTKLPNFAAIHQKHFNQMENLVEHVERKAERAKELSNSAIKIRPVSTQKSMTESKTNKTTVRDKSKAVKKINLEQTRRTPVKPVTASTIATPLKNNERRANLNLPHPKIMITKPALNTTSTIVAKKNVQPASTVKKKLAKPAQLNQVASTSKPAFNLSTSLQPKSTPLLNSTTTASSAALKDKVATRRQRHMDMFKGRTADTRIAAKRGEVIRGVRSNRRFDLQMQHRKNIDQN